MNHGENSKKFASKIFQAHGKTRNYFVTVYSGHFATASGSSLNKTSVEFLMGTNVLRIIHFRTYWKYMVARKCEVTLPTD